MDPSAPSKASAVAGIKASFPLDAGHLGYRVNTGAPRGEGRLELDRRSPEPARRAADRVSLQVLPRRAWAASKQAVQARPVQAVASAVAAGFVLGWLFHWRLLRQRRN